MRKLIVAMMATLAVLVAAPAAYAEETTCTGTIGAETHDNIRVPDGASCRLLGTFVQGTVSVETGARLDAVDVHVNGNVQGEGAAAVIVRSGSFVGGSIQVVQGGSARVMASEIGDSILFDENTARLQARRNDIGGSLQAFANTGGLSIVQNRIDGNLQCKENNPAPIGGGNIVQGVKEDQCASL